MKTDKKLRSICKALSWRTLATMATFIISFLVTHNVHFAFSISIVEVISKLFLYYIHERLWQYLNIWQYRPHKNSEALDEI
jgi:uncharacterized membrane protein